MAKMRLPGGTEIPLFDAPAPASKFETGPTPLEQSIADMFTNRASAQAEFMEAAKTSAEKVGERLEDYELVEDWSSPKKIRWYFRRRS